MASSITYAEGMSKLQLAFDHCLSLPEKLKGDPGEMSLKEMLVKVSVVEGADIEVSSKISSCLSLFELFEQQNFDW